METHEGHRKHKYLLVVAEDVKVCAQRIELDALNAWPVMSLVQRLLSERDVELYEDDHPLGLVRYDIDGLWTLSSPEKAIA